MRLLLYFVCTLFSLPISAQIPSASGKEVFDQNAQLLEQVRAELNTPALPIIRPSEGDFTSDFDLDNVTIQNLDNAPTSSITGIPPSLEWPGNVNLDNLPILDFNIPQRVVGPEETKKIISGFEFDLDAEFFREILESQVTINCDKAKSKYIQEFGSTVEEQNINIVAKNKTEILQFFIESCLRNAKQTDGWENISSRLVVLFDASGKWPLNYYCNGILISDKIVQTSKHCAYAPNGEHGSKPGQLPWKKLFVFSAASPKKKIKVLKITKINGSELENTFEAFNQSDDLALIHLEEPSAIIEQEQFQSEILPNVKSEIQIFGFFPVAGYFSDLNNSIEFPRSGSDLSESEIDKLADGKWVNFIYTDATRLCRAWAVTDKKCLIHTCNTLPGYSGSPVFLKNDGDLRFVASHSGYLLGENSTCKANSTKTANLLPNLAIINPIQPETE